MSSDESLSDPPDSPELPILSDTLDSPELPILPSSSRSNVSTPTSSSSTLRKSKAFIFTAGLYKRIQLATNPPSVQYICTQPNCKYDTTMPSTRVLSTGNLLKNYHARHRGIPTSFKEAQEAQKLKSTPTSSSSQTQFFRKYGSQLSQDRVRKLILDTILSNNLPLRLVESPSFRALMAYLNPYVFFKFVILYILIII